MDSARVCISFSDCKLAIPRHVLGHSLDDCRRSLRKTFPLLITLLVDNLLSDASQGLLVGWSE